MTRLLGWAMLLEVCLGALAVEDAGAQADPDGAGGVAALRAVRTAERIEVDGRLQEAVWTTAPVAQGFRQVDPFPGAPATFDSEVRILFDDRYLYVGVFARDSLGRRGIRVVGLDRDFDFLSNDLFGIALDPFLDRRNSVSFETNPYGARRDLLALNGVMFDRDWDGVWTVKTQLTDSGWVAEFAIPWSTVRYREGSRGSWGVNFVRIIRRVNEQSGWSPWPRQLNHYYMTYAGVLEGLEPPPPNRNFRIQPYLRARVQQTERGAVTMTSTAPAIGGDVKWAISPNTVLDLTANTDFAEADVDRQVLNLTRFSTFFPEKRQFFLESASVFEVGRDRGIGVRPFYTRRIGLDPSGVPIPIDAGARLVHRSVDRSGGFLLIRQRATDRSGPANIGMVRWSENVGVENRIGLQLIGRIDEAGPAGPGARNAVAVVDGFLRRGSAVVRGFATASASNGPGGDGLAGMVWSYTNQSFGYFGWIQEYVGPEYRAAAGFLARQNYIWTSPASTLDLRPSWKPRFVRKFSPGFTTSIYHDADDLEFREGSVRMSPIAAQLNSGAEIRLFWQPEWQRLERPFSPTAGIELPTGQYQFAEVGATYQPDLSRPYWAFVTVAGGSFYDGSRQRVVYRASPFPGPRLRVTLDYEGNRFRGVSPARVSLATHLVSGEIRYTPTPTVSMSAYAEYGSASRLGVWAGRFAWEFRPLSYVFVVYNDRRPSDRGWPGPPRPTERQLLVKLTWLGQL